MRDRYVAIGPFLNGSRNPQSCVGTEPSEQRRGIWIGLELEGLLGSLCQTERCAAAKVSSVQVGTLRDQVLDNLVQAAIRSAVECCKVCFVDRMDIGAGLDEDSDRVLGGA